MSYFAEALQSMSSISFENNAMLVYILKISDCRYMYTRKKCGFHYSKVVGGEITKSHVTLPLIMNPCFLASRPRYMHLSTKGPDLNLQIFQIFLRLQNILTLFCRYYQSSVKLQNIFILFYLPPRQHIFNHLDVHK